MAIPILLDCDPGHDDAVALLLAAGNDAIDLRAITTVAGNCPLDLATLNARRVAALAGLDGVPIAAGAAGPLQGELVTAPDIHGASGLDGYELRTGEAPLDPRPALELMIATLEAATEPITLVPTGPLTNIAVLLQARPDLHERIREIVLMGGSTGRGNTTPAAEFNIHVDPEAAAIVFASGLPVTMVGLNLTHQARATSDVLERVRAVPGEPARAVEGWMEFFGGAYERIHGEFAPPVHDPCTVAMLIDPSLVESVETFVAVETEGRWTRGATVVDLNERLGQPRNARVAMKIDAPRFWALVIGALERLGALALVLLVLAALVPAKADAKRSTCAAPHSRTVVSDDALRVYARRGHEIACAYRNGRRFELGRGSEFFRDGIYNIEHVHLSGAKVAFTVSQDGVDYTVSQVWLRDVRKGRNLVAGASPVVREDACAPGDDRSLQNLVLAADGHLAWTTTYSCAPGLASYREEVVALKPGARPRLLDSGPEDTLDPQSLGLTEIGSRVYWTHGATVRKADV